MIKDCEHKYGIIIDITGDKICLSCGNKVVKFKQKMAG